MSENGSRTHVISYRVTAMEAAHIKAAGAALTNPRRLNDVARAAALSFARQKVPPPAQPIRFPARRKPTVDAEALARVLAALGKVGSNLNQLARVANQRGNLPTEAILRGIADEVQVTCNHVIAALSGEVPDGD